MHPEKASFLAGHLLGEHPAFGTLRRNAFDIYFCRSKLRNAPEQSRIPPIGTSLAETPASRYPHRVGTTSDGWNRETPEIHRNTRSLSYKKMIFWGRRYFAR